MYCYRVSMHCLFRTFATCFYFPKIEHASIVVRFLKFLLLQVGFVGVRWFNIWYDLQYCIMLHRIFHIWAQPRVTSRPPSEEGAIGGNGSDSEIVGWVDPVYWIHVRGPAGRQSQHLRMGFPGTSGARTGDPNVEGSFSAISKPVFAIKIITIFMLQCFELLSSFRIYRSCTLLHSKLNSCSCFALFQNNSVHFPPNVYEISLFRRTFHGIAGIAWYPR